MVSSLQSPSRSLWYDHIQLKNIQKKFPWIIKNIFDVIQTYSPAKWTCNETYKKYAVFLGNAWKAIPWAQKLCRVIVDYLSKQLRKKDKNIGEKIEFSLWDDSYSIEYLGKNGWWVSNKCNFLLHMVSQGNEQKFYIKLIYINNPGDWYVEYLWTTLLQEMWFPVYAPILGYVDKSYSVVVYPYRENFMTVAQAYQKKLINKQELTAIKKKLKNIKKEANQELDKNPSYEGYDLWDFSIYNSLYNQDQDPPFLIMDALLWPK